MAYSSVIEYSGYCVLKLRNLLCFKLALQCACLFVNRYLDCRAKRLSVTCRRCATNEASLHSMILLPTKELCMSLFLSLRSLQENTLALEKVWHWTSEWQYWYMSVMCEKCFATLFELVSDWGSIIMTWVKKTSRSHYKKWVTENCWSYTISETVQSVQNVLQLTVFLLVSVFSWAEGKLEIIVCALYLGTSKKKAKHNAAISLLNQMGVLPALVNGQSSNANRLEIAILTLVKNCVPTVLMQHLKF